MSSKPGNAVGKGRPTTGLSFSLGLSLFYAVFFVVGYLGIFVAADYLIRNAIANKEREIVSERLSEYRAWFSGGQLQELRARFEEQSRRSTDLVFVHITGPGTNALLFSSPKEQEFIDQAQLRELAASGRAVVATLTTGNPRNVWTVASGPLPGGLLMQVGRISTPAFEAADTFRRFFLWAVIPVFLLAVAGGVLLSYRAMKPVRDLTATAGRIVETGKLDQRVEVDASRGDLAEAGVLFNQMLDRNQALIQAMRDSLDNVAHDLRTPMTRLRASAETALSNPDDPEAGRESLADCLEESERVLTMLNTLMDIAEAEAGVMQLHLEKVDLVPLIGQVAELYELAAEERRIKIELAVPDSLEVEGDATRLQQAFANLVDNAVKYGKPDGTVRIHASRENGTAVIRITDDGTGIAPDDLPRIWDRLYRGDWSRSERGLGLGLSFVKAIIDAHGGSASVESEPERGSEFKVRLPVTASSA